MEIGTDRLQRSSWTAAVTAVLIITAHVKSINTKKSRSANPYHRMSTPALFDVLRSVFCILYSVFCIK